LHICVFACVFTLPHTCGHLDVPRALVWLLRSYLFAFFTAHHRLCARASPAGIFLRSRVVWFISTHVWFSAFTCRSTGFFLALCLAHNGFAPLDTASGLRTQGSRFALDFARSACCTTFAFGSHNFLDSFSAGCVFVRVDSVHGRFFFFFFWFARCARKTCARLSRSFDVPHALHVYISPLSGCLHLPPHRYRTRLLHAHLILVRSGYLPLYHPATYTAWPSFSPAFYLPAALLFAVYSRLRGCAHGSFFLWIWTRLDSRSCSHTRICGSHARSFTGCLSVILQVHLVRSSHTFTMDLYTLRFRTVWFGFTRSFGFSPDYRLFSSPFLLRSSYALPPVFGLCRFGLVVLSFAPLTVHVRCISLLRLARSHAHLVTRLLFYVAFTHKRARGVHRSRCYSNARSLRCHCATRTIHGSGWLSVSPHISLVAGSFTFSHGMDFNTLFATFRVYSTTRSCLHTDTHLSRTALFPLVTPVFVFTFSHGFWTFVCSPFILVAVLVAFITVRYVTVTVHVPGWIYLTHTTGSVFIAFCWFIFATFCATVRFPLAHRSPSRFPFIVPGYTRSWFTVSWFALILRSRLASLWFFCARSALDVYLRFRLRALVHFPHTLMVLSLHSSFAHVAFSHFTTLVRAFTLRSAHTSGCCCFLSRSTHTHTHAGLPGSHATRSLGYRTRSLTTHRFVRGGCGHNATHAHGGLRTRGHRCTHASFRLVYDLLHATFAHLPGYHTVHVWFPLARFRSVCV